MSFEMLWNVFSYGAIEAKKGNSPILPAVMTPGGPLDLSYLALLLLQSWYIFTTANVL